MVLTIPFVGLLPMVTLQGGTVKTVPYDVGFRFCVFSFLQSGAPYSVLYAITNRD